MKSLFQKYGGTGRTSSDADVCVSKHKGGDAGVSIYITINPKVLKKLGWCNGDCVDVLAPEVDQRWLFMRVALGSGWRLKTANGGKRTHIKTLMRPEFEGLLRGQNKAEYSVNILDPTKFEIFL